MKRTVARKYAKALFELDKQRIDDFTHLFELFDTHPKLLALLKSPLMDHQEKEKLLENTVGKSVDPLFLKFVMYVLKKGRLNSLREIFVEYELLVASTDNVWRADFVTGVPFQPKARRELIDKLEQHYGKKIECTEHVDPHVIGGTLLLLGNKQIDWSVKSRMKKLKTHLLELDICR